MHLEETDCHQECHLSDDASGSRRAPQGNRPQKILGIGVCFEINFKMESRTPNDGHLQYGYEVRPGAKEITFGRKSEVLPVDRLQLVTIFTIRCITNDMTCCINNMTNIISVSHKQGNSE